MIWTLLIIYQLKHFLADYPLQTSFMLKKFSKGTEYVLPLAAHAGVHAGFTLLTALAVKPAMWWLAIIDFATHFIVDRIKASPDLLGKYKALTASEYQACVRGLSYDGKDPELLMAKNMYARMIKSNTYFWWALGADQTAHHLTHYFIIYMLVMP